LARPNPTNVENAGGVAVILVDDVGATTAAAADPNAADFREESNFISTNVGSETARLLPMNFARKVRRRREPAAPCMESKPKFALISSPVGEWVQVSNIV
jgi:hypothetical protein